MIVTAQPFLNELDLMEVKMRELECIVDRHVVIEADRTYTGIEKPFIMYDHRSRFAQFPIEIWPLRFASVNKSPWDMEKTQHEWILGMIAEIKPKIVIWLDSDEIPRRDVVDRFLAMDVPSASLEMEHLMFFFNRRCTWMKWPFPKISRWPHAPHRHDNLPVITNAGWHCQNFGPKENVEKKLDGFSHAGETVVKEFKEKYLRGEYPGMEDCEAYDDYPQFVKQNRERFVQYFI